METAIQIWNLFVQEVLGFGLRWVIVVVAMLGFGGFIGSRHKAMKKDIKNLKSAVRTTKAELQRTKAESQNSKTDDMKNVAVIVKFPNGDVVPYLNCRIEAPRPDANASAFVVDLGRSVDGDRSGLEALTQARS